MKPSKEWVIRIVSKQESIKGYSVIELAYSSVLLFFYLHKKSNISLIPFVQCSNKKAICEGLPGVLGNKGTW